MENVINDELKSNSSDNECDNEYFTNKSRN